MAKRKQQEVSQPEEKEPKKKPPKKEPPKKEEKKKPEPPKKDDKKKPKVKPKKKEPPPLSPGQKHHFYINPVNHCHGVEVYIYDTTKNMRFGLNRYLMKHNDKKFDRAFDFAGIAVEVKPQFTVKHNGWDLNIYGAIFLNCEDLSVDIIAHECCHAVFMLERNVYRYIGSYDGADNGGNFDIEERFAYCLDDYIGDILSECEKKKLKVLLSRPCTCEDD